MKRTQLLFIFLIIGCCHSAFASDCPGDGGFFVNGEMGHYQDFSIVKRSEMYVAKTVPGSEALVAEIDYYLKKHADVKDGVRGSESYRVQLEIDSSNKELLRDGFSTNTCTKNVAVITAKNIDGLKFGAYEFLENYFRIRWLFPSADGIGTVIPSLASVKIDRKIAVTNPVFINRRFSSLHSGKKYFKSWLDHMKLRSQSKFHHNLSNVLRGNANSQSSSQPELVSGESVYSAVSYLSKEFEGKKGGGWASLGIDDTEAWSEVGLAKEKNSFGYGNYSDYYYDWVNGVAAKVLDLYPAGKIGLLAYAGVTSAPSFPLVENVVPYITIDGMYWGLDQGNKKYRQLIFDWSKKANRLGLYDYVYGDGENPSSGNQFYVVPRLYSHSMSEYLSFASDHGVKDYYAEAYPSEEFAEGPKLYILSKLLWNTNLDVEALLLEWCKAAVGPRAGLYLNSFYLFWEDYWKYRVPKTQYSVRSMRNFMSFYDRSYLDPLTVSDMSYLAELLELVIDNTETTDQNKRALKIVDSFRKSERILRNDTEFRLRNELALDDFSLLYETDFETLDADTGIPAGWRYWSRKGTLVNVEYAGRGFMGGGFGFSMRSKTESEAVAAIYRMFNIKSEGRVCAVSTIATHNESVDLSISYKSGEEWVTKSRLVENSDGHQQRTALCVDVHRSSQGKSESARVIIKVVGGEASSSSFQIFDLQVVAK